MADSFPRQSARTQRFTLGAPRNVTVAPSGARVTFLRSDGGEDPVTALWVLDLPDGVERCVADARGLLAGGDEDLPPEERARRERAREAAGGITAFATDAPHRIAAAALAGKLVVADLDAGTARLLDVPGVVIDPRPDPTGQRVAWCDGRGLWVVEIDDPGGARCLVQDDDPQVTWGLAEFIAAEEMDRFRGFWWSPEGDALLVARVDQSDVPRWWIADPTYPDRRPTEVPYPAAGTTNADVSLSVVRLDGTQTAVDWDRVAWPYLSAASWDGHGPMLAVHPRDQRAMEVRDVDPATGETALLHLETDDTWVERAPGTPARLADGRLVVCSDRDGTRRLLVDGAPVTETDVYVRAVDHVGDDDVVFTVNPVDDATGTAVWRWSPAGIEVLTSGAGVHTATAGGGTLVLRSAALDRDGAITTVHVPEAADRELENQASTPLVHPSVQVHHLGARRLATAILLPEHHVSGTPLPVLLDPYGGPHAQRVLQARGAYLTSQWFADQGFAVVVIDGRGTPGRGSAWERSVRGDLAAPVLEDQLDGLAAAADVEPDLDLGRVAIRGWSFGGYLAALAVLRRPDVVHAAIAGAPVTDWRLYDTFYTERYLGHPDEEPDGYAASSLLTEAAALGRPLLLVHGLADDNVVSAHTLQLSAALLAAGRPHEVLPLTGVTHMASQEDVAENLLLLQLDFLRRALGLSPGPRVAS